MKVYQKDSYDENVEKPVKNVILREPDTTGNYINNGDFSIAENLSDDKNWKFLTTLDGDGKAEIKNHEMVISTVNMGTAAVSYTHLDVYKRQGLDNAVFFCRRRIFPVKSRAIS